MYNVNNSINNGFLSKLHQCRIDVNSVFSEIFAKLDDRHRSLLSQLDEIEKKFIETRKRNVKLDKNVQSKIKLLKDLKSQINWPKKISKNNKIEIKNLEFEIYSYKAEKEIFQNIQLNLKIANNTINSIDKLCDLTTIITPDYDNRTSSCMLYNQKGRSSGKFCAPRDVALDSCDNIYVADIRKILVFSLNGELLREFGEGYIMSPYGICIHSNSVYVTDWLDHCVMKFNLIGSFVGQTDSEYDVSNNTLFDEPCGICCTNDGLLYICDCNNDRIQVLNDNLQWEKIIKNDNIKKPRDVKIFDDNIYVLLHQSVLVLSKTNEQCVSILPHVFKRAYYFTFDINHEILLVSDWGSSCIHVITKINNYTHMCLLGSLEHTKGDCLFTCGVTVTKCHKIVNVCGYGNARLQLY